MRKMIVLRKFPLKVGEAWFSLPAERARMDVVNCRQVSDPELVARLVQKEEFKTLILDLTRSDRELEAAVGKNCRYEIHRAQEKDGLFFGPARRPDEQLIRRFCQCYDEFAAEAGMPCIDPHYVHALAEAGALRISHASKNDEILVYHALVVADSRTRLLYSISRFRGRDSAYARIVARANRWLHWKEIEQVKADGMVHYDFGGWYAGSCDIKKLRINRFKEGFGGTIITEFNGKLLVSGLARIAFGIRQLIRRTGAGAVEESHAQ